MRSIIKIFRTRLSRWVRLWKDIFCRSALAPLIDSGAQLQVFGFFFTLYFIQQSEGILAMLESLTPLQAFFWAIIFYWVWCALKAAICVSTEERKLGAWTGARFNYHHPFHVFTYHITPQDDGKIIKVVFRDAEPNCLVCYKIEYDGGIAKILFNSNVEEASWFWDKISRTNQSGSLIIGKNKEAKMIVNCGNNSDQTTVRIYMLYWEIYN